MAKLPDPPDPAQLRRISPEWKKLGARTALARIYFAGGEFPVAWNELRYWGPAPAARFDHHLAGTDGKPCRQDRGVLYCATQGMTCLAEVFQRTRVIDRSTGEPQLCVFAPRRPLRLLDLTGAFATRMGASLAIHSGPRPRGRAWARALYEAYDHDGLLYLSSMNAGAGALVLNDRAAEALPEALDFNRPLADPTLTDLIDACAARLGYLKL